MTATAHFGASWFLIASLFIAMGGGLVLAFLALDVGPFWRWLEALREMVGADEEWDRP